MDGRRGPLSASTLALYTSLFLDLFGFGMIFPDIQLRAERMGAPGWLIGAALASTFVVQLLVSPLWGRVSDRVGRKPVLLICTGLSAAGLLLYGFAETIPFLFLSRMVSGAGGANVAVAQALIADTTSESDRTASMGHLSAAISFGLILGPVVGGLVGQVSSSLVGICAGVASGCGVLLIFALVRSGPPKSTSESRPFSLALLRDFPSVRMLAGVAAVAWFSLAMLEGTFGRLIEATLGYGKREFGIVLGYEAMLGFVIQAFLIGWFVKKLGDRRLLTGAYVFQGLGLALMPFTFRFPVHAAWFAVLLGASTLFAFGSGLANPTLNALCSKTTPENRQGELFGLLQGARSIGFVVGPILGGALFDRWFAAPYLVAGLTCLAASCFVGLSNRTT